MQIAWRVALARARVGARRMHVAASKLQAAQRARAAYVRWRAQRRAAVALAALWRVSAARREVCARREARRSAHAADAAAAKVLSATEGDAGARAASGDTAVADRSIADSGNGSTMSSKRKRRRRKAKAASTTTVDAPAEAGDNAANAQPREDDIDAAAVDLQRLRATLKEVSDLLFIASQFFNSIRVLPIAHLLSCA